MLAERAVRWCIIRLRAGGTLALWRRLKSMLPLRFPVTVIMQRIPLSNRWADERWEAVACEPAADSAPGCTRLSHGPEGTRWSCSGHAIELHPAESEGYYLNASTREPRVFVLWRMAEAEDALEPRARPLIVSVSYAEAARFLDAGEQVDAVPMPAPIRAALDAFVATHYKPEPRRKGQRNPLYEEADLRRGETPSGRRR